METKGYAPVCLWCGVYGISGVFYHRGNVRKPLDVSQLKRDVNAIADVLTLERDAKGQLRKAG